MEHLRIRQSRLLSCRRIYLELFKALTKMTSSNTTEAEAHRIFSAQCFNRARDLIRKPHRTDPENEQMLLLSQASLWHWTQRPDCTSRNLSIAHWQLSRIYALLDQPENALGSAGMCLRYSEATSPSSSATRTKPWRAARPSRATVRERPIIWPRPRITWHRSQA